MSDPECQWLRSVVSAASDEEVAWTVQGARERSGMPAFERYGRLQRHVWTLALWRLRGAG